MSGLKWSDIKTVPVKGAPFLTGSRVYGTPGRDSDTDLVVLLDPAALRALHEAAQEGDQPQQERAEDYLAAGGLSLRFGPLNLICCTSESLFEVWRKATTDLVARKPVTRDEACAYMKKARADAGFGDS